MDEVWLKMPNESMREASCSPTKRPALAGAIQITTPDHLKYGENDWSVVPNTAEERTKLEDLVLSIQDLQEGDYEEYVKPINLDGPDGNRQ